MLKSLRWMLCQVSQSFLSACSPESLDSGHCWHVQRIKLEWAYSIFSLGFVFCLMFMYMFVPWFPIRAKALLKKVRDCEDAIYPFSSVMSPKHVCLRTVRYWLSPPTAAARRLARSVSEISRRKGAASQPAQQSTRAASSAALSALQSKRRRAPPLDPRLLQPFVSCWYQELQTVIERETLLLDSISRSIHIGSISHVGVWTVLWQLTRLTLKKSEKWQTSKWI